MADYYSRATQLKDACSTGEQLSLLVSNNEVASIFRQFGDFSISEIQFWNDYGLLCTLNDSLVLVISVKFNKHMIQNN